MTENVIKLKKPIVIQNSVYNCSQCPYCGIRPDDGGWAITFGFDYICTNTDEPLHFEDIKIGVDKTCPLLSKDNL